MQDQGSIETFFPFVVIILVYLITNIRKQMKKKEKEAAKPTPRPSPPKPAMKAAPPPQKIELEVIKEELQPLEKQEAPFHSKPQPRIKTLVGSLRSKKDLILLSEILKRNF